MKRLIYVFLMLFIVSTSFALTFSAMKLGAIPLTYAATFIRTTINGSPATVVRVRDGDTIVVNIATLTNVPVRLLGVDTPEDVDPRKPVQYFSMRAASFTKQMLTGKQVYLTFDKHRYGVFHRMLAYVWIRSDNGYVMFNALLIINGYGKYYPKYKFRSDYMQLFNAFQQYAVANRLGMWQLPDKVGKSVLLTIANISPSGKDEYVQIENTSHSVMNLRGWKLTSKPGDRQTFIFPDITLKVGKSVYVHSGRDAGSVKLPGINIIWTTRYIWNNKGDVCTLKSPDGHVVDEYKY